LQVNAEVLKGIILTKKNTSENGDKRKEKGKHQ